MDNRVWFDTEFIDNGTTIDLISIGLVRADNETYYAEAKECDLSKACDWVKKNVLSKLTGVTKPRDEIAHDIVQFAGRAPEFWAYYAAYDWVGLCQLYGRMIDVPNHWPHYVRDFKVLAGVHYMMPKTLKEHNALADAVQLKKEHLKFERM